MADSYKIAERRVDAKIKFYRNLCAYIVVNTLLAIVNWIFTPSYWWVIFPIAFWGIGVAADFFKAFVLSSKFDNVNYREEKIQEELEKIKNEG